MSGLASIGSDEEDLPPLEEVPSGGESTSAFALSLPAPETDGTPVDSEGVVSPPKEEPQQGALSARRAAPSPLSEVTRSQSLQLQKRGEGSPRRRPPPRRRLNASGPVCASPPPPTSPPRVPTIAPPSTAPPSTPPPSMAPPSTAPPCTPPPGAMVAPPPSHAPPKVLLAAAAAPPPSTPPPSLQMSKNKKTSIARTPAAKLFDHVRAMGPSMVSSLLSSKPELISATDCTGKTALHVACAFGVVEVVKLLLERGADTGAKDNGGSAPLHWAAMNGHEEVCLQLVRADANINLTNRRRENALHLACASGNLGTVHLLKLLGADLTQKNADRKRPLEVLPESLRGFGEAMARGGLKKASLSVESRLYDAL